jgi:hypothetical protein
MTAFRLRWDKERDFVKKQASNIPMRRDEAYQQKRDILAISTGNPQTRLSKSWSFWVFVQIIGFQWPPKCEPGSKRARPAIRPNQPQVLLKW